MAIQSWLGALSLVASTTAWPQPTHGDDSNLPLAPRSLPVVDEAEPLNVLHLIQSDWKRHLPVVEDEVESMGTLHILQSETDETAPDADDDDSSGVLTLPVIHAPRLGLVSRDIEVQLENRSDVAYYAQLYMGNPPQEIYAQIDTGSFELWVNPDCTSLSSSGDQTFCKAAGQYSPSDSSTSEKTGDSRNLNYGTGSAKVSYYEDDVALSKDAKLKGIQFGVADETEGQFAAVLGLGYGEGKNTEYPNFIDELKDQGVVKSKTFSVALGSKEEGGGAAIFGGVDTGKFKGKLTGLPILSDVADDFARYWVQLESISHSASGQSSKKWDDTEMPVFVDTGSTLTLLPSDLVETMAKDLGSDGKDDAGFWNIDCSLVDEAGSLDFEFDGVTVKVPYKEIIREFHQTCYLGISSSDQYALLGDTFLRAAYVVFDLDSDTIWMAEYENCGSEVSSIKKSSDLKDLQGSCGSGSNQGSQNKSTSNSSSGSQDDDEEEEDEEEETSSSSTAPTTATSTTTGGLPIVTGDSDSSSKTSAAKPTSTDSSNNDDEEDEDESNDSDNSSDSGNDDDVENDVEDNGAASLSSWLSIYVGVGSVLVLML